MRIWKRNPERAKSHSPDFGLWVGTNVLPAAAPMKIDSSGKCILTGYKSKPLVYNGNCVKAQVDGLLSGEA